MKESFDLAPEAKEERREIKLSLKTKAMLLLNLTLSAARAVNAQEGEPAGNLKDADFKHGGDQEQGFVEKDFKSMTVDDLMASLTGGGEGGGNDDLDLPDIDVKMPDSVAEGSDREERNIEEEIASANIEKAEITDEGDHYTIELPKADNYEVEKKKGSYDVVEREQIEKMGGEARILELVKMIQKKEPGTSDEDARAEAIRFLTEDVKDMNVGSKHDFQG